MTPRRALLTFALGCLAWLAFGFIALCAHRGYMPHLLLSLGAVWLYWKRTQVCTTLRNEWTLIRKGN